VVKAKYITATPRGIFQGMLVLLTSSARDHSPALAKGAITQLNNAGFWDLHPDNFSPGGVLFDYQAPRFGGVAAGSQTVNPRAVMKPSPTFMEDVLGSMKAHTLPHLILRIQATRLWVPCEKISWSNRLQLIIPRPVFECYDYCSAAGNC
jgi:hypothetical protein